jgi:hypothetical protein
MWIYAALLLLPPTWAAAERRSPSASRAAAIAIGLCLTLFLGLRRDVGGDWHSYWLMFERAQSHDLATALVISDPAYMALNVLAGRLGLSLAAVNLVCAAFVAWGAIALAARQSRPWVALLVATPVLLLVVATHTTRQSAAIGLELLALSLFLDRRRAAPAAALILACSFHWSAAVLLPLIPLFLMPPQWRRALWLCLVALGLAAAAAMWLFEQGRGFHSPAFGAALRLLPSLLALARLLLLRRSGRLSGPEGIAAAFLGGLTLFCLALWPVSSLAADRLGFYTIALQMLVWPAAIAALPSGRERLAASSALVALYLLLFTGWAMLSDYAACMVPYGSYLQQPQLLLGPNPIGSPC